jgi:hypothetical protein
MLSLSEICKGQVIFEDNFNDFNFATWEHENTLAGGGVGTKFALEQKGGNNSF